LASTPPQQSNCCNPSPQQPFNLIATTHHHRNHRIGIKASPLQLSKQPSSWQQHHHHNNRIAATNCNCNHPIDCNHRIGIIGINALPLQLIGINRHQRLAPATIKATIKLASTSPPQQSNHCNQSQLQPSNQITATHHTATIKSA